MPILMTNGKWKLTSAGNLRIGAAGAPCCCDECFRKLLDCDGNEMDGIAVPCKDWPSEQDVKLDSPSGATFCGKIGPKFTAPLEDIAVLTGLQASNCATCPKQCGDCLGNMSPGQNPGCPHGGFCCPECYSLAVVIPLGCCGCQSVGFSSSKQSRRFTGTGMYTLNTCTGVEVRTGGQAHWFSDDFCTTDELIEDAIPGGAASATCFIDARGNARASIAADFGTQLANMFYVPATNVNACVTRRISDNPSAAGLPACASNSEHCGGMLTAAPCP